MSTFTTVKTEGALLPVDVLERIVALDRSLGGLTESDYQVEGGQKLNERISYAFNRALALWSAFSTARERLEEGDVGTTLTRDRWLLPLLSELGWRRLPAAGGIDIEDRRYPVSHEWQARPEDVPVPVHLLGAGRKPELGDDGMRRHEVSLDKRTEGMKGAATRSPHSLMQELLNRSKERLWGFLSNGLRFRVLRDNASLTRQAFVEFDLERMMVERAYNDFRVFWLLCHESRVEAQRIEDMWIEKWSRTAQSEGTRAFERLRGGVQQAIEALGSGFLRHPANGDLREALRNGTLDKRDYYRQLLRMAYRLIFLCVAEDRTYEKDGTQRSLLMRPDASEEACSRYRDHYSVRRLREKATRRKGTRHGDLFATLRLVMDRLGADEGCPQLGLPALGSFLWAKEAVYRLASAELSNVDLLAAVRGLSVTRDGTLRRVVDYRNLGAEELGSVYEALLDLHPRVDVEAGAFKLAAAGGSERKTTGSYYTPTSLIDCLLDSALDPVIEEAAKKGEDGILALKVCDPACGSGHFLIAAAHRIAHKLASVRTGDEEPAPSAVRHALRDVISHCIYGVDLNEMAVELCKVSLWMDSLEPGKPLSFLDHRILCGNSLLGTTPALMANGIPEEAFTAIEGDDKKICSALKKRNKQERQGQLTLGVTTTEVDWKAVEQCAVELNIISEDSIDDVQVKAKHFQACARSEAYRRQKLAADAWCAAFVCKKAKNAPELTHDTWKRIASGGKAPSDTVAEVERLAEQYKFLHWHLAFPDVFRVSDEAVESQQAGWSGGFDAVLGNPPWERVKLQEQEWFAERDPDIAAAPTAAVRKKMIEALIESRPLLHQSFLEDRRRAEGESNILRNGGRHPLCGRGDVNTYAVFSETMQTLLLPRGRLGIVVPSGIATDDTTKLFFSQLMSDRALCSVYDFENEERLFPSVHHSMRFCLLVAGRRGSKFSVARFVFFARQTEAVHDETRTFTLTVGDTRLLNPNSGTCPTFRSRRDAEINKSIYRRVPVLVRLAPDERNAWSVTIRSRLWHMAEDSDLFRTARELLRDDWRLQGNVFSRDGEFYSPLYEAKMVHHFECRFGTYEGQTESQSNMGQLPQLTEEQRQDPCLMVQPKYWVPEREVVARLKGVWDHLWLFGWRDICRPTDARTLIASLVPRVAVGHTYPLLMPARTASEQVLLYANLCSFVLDYTVRMKLGGTHLTYSCLQQLPVLEPRVYSAACLWRKDQSLGLPLAHK